MESVSFSLSPTPAFQINKNKILEKSGRQFFPMRVSGEVGAFSFMCSDRVSGGNLLCSWWTGRTLKYSLFPEHVLFLPCNPLAFKESPDNPKTLSFILRI